MQQEADAGRTPGEERLPGERPCFLDAAHIVWRLLTSQALSHTSSPLLPGPPPEARTKTPRSPRCGPAAGHRCLVLCSARFLPTRTGEEAKDAFTFGGETTPFRVTVASLSALPLPGN